MVKIELKNSNTIVGLIFVRLYNCILLLFINHIIIMILLRYNKWILEVTIKNGIDNFILSNEWTCVYPIQYDNGNIVYDMPEIVPKGLLKKIEKNKFSIQNKINLIK